MILANGSIIANEILPLPVMPARNGFIHKVNNGYKFNFLNQTFEMNDKINWKLNITDNNFRLWLMNLHYMEYLEEVNNNDFIKIIEDWIEQNKIFRNNFDWAAWNSYSLSLRTLVWMQQFALRGINLNLAQYEKINKSLILQLLYLERNIEKDIGGNHIIKNIKALLWAAKFFNGNHTSRWKEIAVQLLNKELDEQILPDGVHFELSTAYHCQVFVDLLECYSVLEDSHLKSKLYNKLYLMTQAINDFTHPDDNICVFNDGSVNMSYPANECLKAWEKISGNFTRVNRHIKLESSGYFGFKNKAIYIMIDAGRVGADHLPAHSHGDIFSFELSAGKERIIVDPGVYEYNPGEKRNYSRATSSHNTLTLDDVDQCEFYGAFRVARRANVKIQNYVTWEDGFELSAAHDGYKRLSGKPLHSRKFKLNKNIIEITDEIIGGNGQLAAANLLLHPECAIIPSDNEIRIIKNDSIIIINTPAKYEIMPAYYFPAFGKSTPAKKIKIFYGKSPCKGSFQIAVSNTTGKVAKSSYAKLNLV